jgi:hypothetical protein
MAIMKLREYWLQGLRLMQSHIFTTDVNRIGWICLHSLQKSLTEKYLITDESLSNYLSCRATGTMENDFGLMENRFRVFHTEIWITPTIPNTMFTISWGDKQNEPKRLQIQWETQMLVNLIKYSRVAIAVRWTAAW